jgi:hypothetical protein
MQPEAAGSAGKIQIDFFGCNGASEVLFYAIAGVFTSNIVLIQ